MRTFIFKRRFPGSRFYAAGGLQDVGFCEDGLARLVGNDLRLGLPSSSRIWVKFSRAAPKNAKARGWIRLYCLRRDWFLRSEYLALTTEQQDLFGTLIPWNKNGHRYAWLKATVM